jgi:hypothetical protein
MRRWEKLNGNQVHGLFFTRVATAISGVTHAEQNSRGEITLYYTDGTRETACPDPAIDLVEYEDGLRVVSAVQNLRTPSP